LDYKILEYKAWLYFNPSVTSPKSRYITVHKLLQWILSNTDNIGPQKCVLIREAFSFQGRPFRRGSTVYRRYC